MLKRVFRGWRYLLRALAMAMAALSLSWGIALTEGLVAAMLGAVLGVVAGELLGRSRLRLPVAVAGLGLGLLVAWKAAAITVGNELVPDLIGPGNALVAVGVVRFGMTAFALVGALRTMAVRRPWALALELGLVSAAFASVFSSHRDGVIARPLWLSDWAWQQGIDPSHVFLAIGGVAVVILAVMLVAEAKGGRALSSLLVLAGLALLAVLTLNVTGLPRPQPANDLGLTNDAGSGDPPREPPPMDGGSGRDPNQQDGGQGGQGGPDGDDGQGGQGGDPDASDGYGQGGGDGDDGGGSSGTDGGDGGGMPPPEQSDGSIGQAPPPQDGGRPPPPPSEQLETQGPSNSPAPMAVVVLDDDYSPPSQAYYFRQEAWSQLAGPRLVRTTRTDVDLDTQDDFPTERTSVRDIPPATGRTPVNAMVAMLVEHTHPFALESARWFEPAQNPNPSRFVRAYRFQSISQTIEYRNLVGRTGGDRRWSREVREYYLRGSTDPRFGNLARQIVSTLPPRLRNDPFALALKVKLYLDHELIYSTRHRHAGVPDPTADFLFGNRTGYCVHFAHSAVFLWRSLGVPSRISTGYHSDESNRRGGSTILIRGGDAHAWPELYLDGLGWIVLDISAERNLDPPGQGTDEDLQRILGEMARQQPPRPDEPPPRRRAPPTHYGRDLGYGTLALLVAALVGLYLTKLWRRVAPAFAGPESLPRVGYRKALDQLAEAGLKRRWGEPREDFARRVEAVVPSFGRLTALHLAARFGDPERAPGGREERTPSAWRETMKAVSAELAKGTKRWRRALGLVNPASFLDVH